MKARPDLEVMSAGTRSFYECETDSCRLLAKVDAKPIPLPMNAAILDRLGAYAPPKYRAPRFFGSLAFEGGYIQLWEYIEGDRIKFNDYSEEKLLDFLRALASADVESIPSDSIRDTFWMKPISKRLLNSDFEQFRAKFRWLSRMEGKIIDRLSKMSPQCITHNDLHSFNVMHVEEGFVIIDWDSVSLGPPGASLRVFAEWPTERQTYVADAYAGFMKEGGVDVDADDVLFAMRAHQAFHRLYTGLSKKSSARIKRGVRLLPLLKP